MHFSYLICNSKNTNNTPTFKVSNCFESHKWKCRGAQEDRRGILETLETLWVECHPVTWPRTGQSESWVLSVGLMQLMGNHRRPENTRSTASNRRTQMLSTKAFGLEFTCCIAEALNISSLQTVFKWLYFKWFYNLTYFIMSKVKMCFIIFVWPGPLMLYVMC